MEKERKKKDSKSACKVSRSLKLMAPFPHPIRAKGPEMLRPEGREGGHTH